MENQARLGADRSAPARRRLTKFPCRCDRPAADLLPEPVEEDRDIAARGNVSRSGTAFQAVFRRDADAVAVAAVYDRRGQIGDRRSPLQFIRELFFQLLLPIVQGLQTQLPASP